MSAATSTSGVEYSHSYDGENYQGQFSTIAEAMREAIAEIGDNHGATFYVGKTIPFVARGDAESVIDQLSEQAHDECGEHAEDYLGGVTDEQKKELEDFISAWADRVETPNFWTIGETKKYTVAEALEIVAGAA